MVNKYLIVRETDFLRVEGGILYAGEGSFNDWKEKIETVPKSDRIYEIQQITLGTQKIPGQPTKQYLTINMTTVDPIHDGSSALDLRIHEQRTLWAGINLDQRVKEMLHKALEDLI